MTNRLLKNFFSGIGLRVFNVIATFIATPVLIFNLGDSGYGFLVLLLGIIGFGGLLDLGLTQSLVRELAAAPLNRRQSLYATSAWLYIFLGVFGAGIVWILREPILDYIVKMPKSENVDMTIAMAMVAFSLPLKMLTTFSGAILNAMEEIHEANIAQSIGVVARFVIAASFASIGFPLELVVVAFPFSFVFTFAVQLYYLRRINWLNPLELTCFDRTHLSPLIRTGSGLFVAQTAGELALHADKFIISSVLGVAALTPYNIAYLLAARVSDLGSIIASITFPRIVQLLNVNMKEAWNLYKRGMLYTLMLGFFIIAGIAIFGKWFLVLWVGEDKTLAALPLLIPFLFGVFIGLPSWLNGNMLIALNKSHTVAFTVVVGACLSIILCYFGTLSVGIIGGAWAWAVGYAAIAILQLLFLRRHWMLYEKA
jgi:O-antigen/teichoic acid export membrane protein